MQAYQPLGSGVYHLDAHYIEAGVASFYCIVEQDEIAVIETGTSFSLPYLQQFLEDHNLAADQVRYVMPTHVHLDHAGGAGVMMQAFPNAELVIHPRGARHMIDPARLIEGTIAVYGEEKFKRLYGDVPPIDEKRVIKAAHEQVVRLQQRELLILDTPGHAYHHYCVYDAASRGIFSGDTFGVSYPSMVYDNRRVVIPTTTPVQFDPDALHDSVDLLMRHKPQRIYLTHYNLLTDPVRVVDQYRTWIDRFVEITEQVAPEDDSKVPDLARQLGEAIHSELHLPMEMVQTQLENDITLNAQGLAIWYQRREQ